MTNTKNWTVMVYQFGNNLNLSEGTIYAIKELYRVGVTPDVAVIVQFQTSGMEPKTWRYVVDTKETRRTMEQGTSVVAVTGQGNRIAEHIVSLDTDGILENLAKEIPLVNPADPAVLKNFVSESMTEHPAKHYMLVLRGYSSRVEEDILSRKSALGEIRKTVEAKKIDVLGMDTCPVSMAEVGHEICDNVGFLVGAEGFEPSADWPYHRILEVLKANSRISPRDLAEAVVEKYVRYYRDYKAAGISTHQSASDLQHFDRLVEAVRDLALVLKEGLKNPEVGDAIMLARWKAQSYNNEQHVDLYDFCDLLGRHLSLDGYMLHACYRVKALIDPVVLKSEYSGPAFQYSHGLSIYFPRTEISARYNSLAFAKETGWREFLKEYVKSTRRHRRKAFAAEGRELALRSQAGDYPLRGTFEMYLSYKMLRADHFAKLMGVIDDIYRLVYGISNLDSILRLVTNEKPDLDAGAFLKLVEEQFRSSPEDRLEIHTAFTGQSITIRWKTGWLPSASISEDEDGKQEVVLKIPKKVAPILITGYILLSGLQKTASTANEILDAIRTTKEITKISRELKEKATSAPPTIQKLFDDKCCEFLDLTKRNPNITRAKVRVDETI